MTETVPSLHTDALRSDLLDRISSSARKMEKVQRAEGHGKEAEARRAIAEFESLFISYMLKSMRETIEKSELLDGGTAEEVYTAMLDDEYAKKIADGGGIGLGRLLEAELLGASGSAISKPRSLAEYRRQALAAPQDSPFVAPVKGTISSQFGFRTDPFTQETRFHSGIDVALPPGSYVRAAAPGRVVFSDWRGDYGNLVILKHADGFTTRYGHNQRNLVRVGDQVEGGQPLALVGETGRATGPHLHFEVRRRGTPMDPLALVSMA